MAKGDEIMKGIEEDEENAGECLFLSVSVLRATLEKVKRTENCSHDLMFHKYGINSNRGQAENRIYSQSNRHNHSKLT